MLRVVKEFVVPPPLPESASPTPSQQSTHPGTSPSPVLSVDGETGVADPKWCEAFVLKGGFKHLYAILMEQGKLDDVTDTLSQRCLAALLEIIRHLLHFSLPNPQKIIFAEADASLLTERLIDLAYKTIESPLSPPPEPLPPIIANRIVIRGRIIMAPIVPPNREFEAFGQIIMHTLDALNGLLKERKDCLDFVVRNEHWDEMLRHGIFHSVPQIRQSLATGLCTLATSFNEILRFITPQLLALLHTLDTSALSHLCNEYFNLVGKLLWTEEQQMIEAKRLQLLPQGSLAGGMHRSASAASNSSRDGGEVNDAEDDNGVLIPKFTDFTVDPRHELLKALREKIMSHPMTEASVTTVDNMLCGLFTLTVQLLRNQPADVKADIGMTCGLVGDLLSCLFAMPTSESRATGLLQPPKCKSTASRELAFNVLTELSNGCEVNGRAIVEYITPFHYQSHSGGQRPNDWSFEPRYDDKSTTGYVGLQNLGCICYMNAPLQQLFMIPQLRRAILSIDTYKESDLNDSLVYQLQLLFGILQESDVQAASPAGICQAFKDLDGKPTDVRIQDDSGSFLQKLLDRLCMSTKATPYERAIPDVLGGVLCHELIGRGECTHYRDRAEEFYGLSVEVQNKKSLIDSLTQFVQGEVLEGGNAYRCDQCNKKVDTLKRTCIKKLPPTIFFVLKRFALDYNTMETTKINDRLEFPTYIDMRPYCIESLAGAERTAAQAHNAANGKADDNDGTDTHPPEYYQYVVRGIVVHTGSANGGHYYSFAQARSDDDEEADSITAGKWFKFNDSVVTPFNPADIPDECFGGMEEAPIPPTKGNQHGGGVGTFEKYRNAYLIWYDRVKRPVDPSKLNQISYASEINENAASTAAGVVTNVNKRGRVPIPQAMMDDIWRGNINHWRDRAVFDRQYVDFVGRIVMSQMGSTKIKHSDSDADVDAQYRPDALTDEVFATLNVAARGVEPPLAYRQQVIQLATRFILMAFSRARIRENFMNWINFIRKLYDGDLVSSQWLIMLFTANNGLLAFEFLLLCPDIIVRNGVAELLCQCLTQLAPYSHRLLQSAKREPSPEPANDETSNGGAIEGVASVDDSLPNSVLNFGHILTVYLTAASFHWRNFDSYFKVFSHFASLSPFEARWLVSQYNMAARALDFFLNDASIHPELNPLPTLQGNRIPHRDETGAVPDQTHFLAFACQLLCACKQPQVLPIQAANPEQMVQLEPTPGLIEMNLPMLELLLYREGNDGFIVHLLQLASTRKRSAPVCQAIQHLCYNNLSLTDCILSCIRRGLEWFDWNGIRSYLRIISSLIKLNDTIQVQRVSAVMSMLVSVTVGQTRFWKLTDFCLDHIIRLAKTSTLAYDYLHEHPTDIEPLMTFMKKYPDPPTGRYNAYGGSAHGPPQLLKKHPESNHRMTSADYETYGLPMKMKLDSLERILCGQPLENDATSDSDLDFSDRVLNVGDWIDCCDAQNKWNCACVIEVDQVKRLVWVKFSGWTSKWNEWIPINDGKRIRKLGTFTTKQQIDNRTTKGASNANKKNPPTQQQPANTSENNAAANKPAPPTK